MAQNPFKALNINIDKIESALTQNGVTNFSLKVKNEKEMHLSGMYKSVDFLIKLMPSGGNTTIGKASGQNNTYFDEIAGIIKENCLYSDKKTFEYTIPTFSDENSKMLFRFLSEEDININEDNNNDPNCKHQYIMTSGNGDRVRAKIYSRGSIQFQGKYLKIASLINDFMCTILNMKEIIEQKNQEFNVDIKKETIESELHSKLSKSIELIHGDIIKQLSCSLIMKKIDVEMDDYSTYCFPALRSVEGFMYQLLGGVCSPSSSKNLGEYFTENKPKYVIRDIHQGAINGEMAEVLCECYTYWHENRHGLFHMKPGVADTKVIDKAKSIEIIDTVCQLIDGGMARLK
ncbi:type II toxin-antitoxin system RnlA family toxin [Morganella morganii]|uniref:type II toxin-antitoxin system mRNA endoribonuclease LsoA n=1 Tax=Morganella morganii TaxID=582 RepID=UPI002246C294|nr:type II toxin-antitoxin system RnlA family toxin [Morganella morganii]MCW9737945.1 type II toxin-antitoxin system RnlA family toxin [Morganella morganii]